MSLKPGDTYLIEGKVMMVVERPIQELFYLVRIVGANLVGPPRARKEMEHYLDPFTKLSRGM